MGAQIRPGAESVALARQDGDAQLGVVTKIRPDLAQPIMDVQINRVLHLGTVQRDVGDLASLRIEHFVRHGVPH